MQQAAAASDTDADAIATLMLPILLLPKLMLT